MVAWGCRAGHMGLQGWSHGVAGLRTSEESSPGRRALGLGLGLGLGVGLGLGFTSDEKRTGMQACARAQLSRIPQPCLG